MNRPLALQRILNRLKPEMADAAEELLGSHYVPEYYESAASYFVFIAEHAVREAWKAAKRRRKTDQQQGREK